MTDLSPPSRRDALPDNHNWRDAGCKLNPSCLGCPLPRCRYDKPLRQQQTDGARRITGRLIADGQTAIQIAEALSTSLRTAQRHIARNFSTEGKSPPRPRHSPHTKQRARDLRAAGWTYHEIADALGIAISTVSVYVRDTTVC